MVKPARYRSVMDDEYARLIADAEVHFAERITQLEEAESDGTLGTLASALPPVSEQLRPFNS